MEMLRPVISVCFVFLLLGAACWWLRRMNVLQRSNTSPQRLSRLGFEFQSGKGEGRLRASDRLALSPNHAVHLIRVAGRGLVVGVHPSGFILLKELPWCEIEASKVEPDREGATQ